MEPSSEGRRKSMRLMKIPAPTFPTLSSSTSAKRRKTVIKTKVVPSGSKGQVDSTSFAEMDACPSGEKAIGISLILQCLISKMNISGLKMSRLVSKIWKNEADLEIRHRNCFRLRFHPESRPLSEGLKELEFSKNVPCFDFHLTLCESESENNNNNDESQLAEIEQLIFLFGSQIKSLTLNSKVTGTDSLSTLLVGAKNMEKLYLTDKFERQGCTQRDLDLKLTLPEGALSNLKHIKYLADEDPCAFYIAARSRIFEILDKGPNLKSITNMDFDHTSTGTLKGKVHLLKSLASFPDFDSHSSDLNSGLKVETLFLSCDSGEQESIRKIVKLSEDTLKTLVTTLRFICLPKTGGFGPLFLPLQNIKVLQIRFERELWEKFTDNDFESEHLTQFGQEAFRNLTTVILELPDILYQNFLDSKEKQVSPFKSCIKTVVNLELRGRVNRRWSGRWYWVANDNWVQRLKELFPNVKGLKLKDSPEIPRMLPSCFAHWPRLESLEIHINFQRPGNMGKGSKNPYFDAMKQYENLDPVFTAQILTCLTELKKLDLIFSDIRPGISRTKCPISPVSLLHLSKLLPNLKIRVLYDQNLAKFDPGTRTFQDEYKMNDYLKHLIPHCELGHWENGGVASWISAKIPPNVIAVSNRAPWRR